MEPIVIDPRMTVDKIMRRWPGTIRVFIRNRMLCIGCPIGVFHTVADACAAHGLDEDSLSRELLAAMQGDVRSSEGSASIPRACEKEPAAGSDLNGLFLSAVLRDEHEAMRIGDCHFLTAAANETFVFPRTQKPADGVERRPGHLRDILASDREVDLDSDCGFPA